jgi:hypothetical protein
LHQLAIFLADIEQHGIASQLPRHDSRRATACKWIKYHIPFLAADPDAAFDQLFWKHRDVLFLVGHRRDAPNVAQVTSGLERKPMADQRGFSQCLMFRIPNRRRQFCSFAVRAVRYKSIPLWANADWMPFHGPVLHYHIPGR